MNDKLLPPKRPTLETGKYAWESTNNAEMEKKRTSIQFHKALRFVFTFRMGGLPE